VLTSKDVPGTNRFGTMYKDTPVLADDKVRCFGDAVALVVADNQKAAERALNLIKVEYEELPGVFNPIEGLSPEAPLVHENGNLLQHFKVRKGDVNEGFRQCVAVAENTFTTSMISHAYMELECSVAEYEQGMLTVWTSTQDVYGDRRQIAAALGLPLNKVRVVQMTTGGAFGGKIDVTTEILAALAALKTGRPVKVRFSREESMMISTKRHPVILKVRLGANKEGKLLAMEGEIYGDTGAYASLGAAVIRKCGLILTGPYYIPNIKVDTFCVYTNNPPAGAFRGFGIVQGAFAHESLMDMLAESLGRDKWEFRYQNALEPGLSVGTGQVLEHSVGIKGTLEAVKKYIAENPLTPING
jgi:CO/xanthine dehydrogenase Mo-binding subunit